MGTLVADQGVMTLVAVAIVAICAALALFILYSVIWRAVRRGLREFHRPAATHSLRRVSRGSAKAPSYVPSDWV